MLRSIAKTVTFGAAALLLLQSAAATWYMGASFEPDTNEDDPRFMRVDPPGLATDQIYFNVISGHSSFVGGYSINPNVGALETRVRPLTLEYHVANLGVWVDCNGDGYVGMAAGALREYPAQALTDATVCPPASGHPNQWPAGAHNYNGWVSELIPIGDNTGSDRRVYGDADAKVWGDYNRPADPSLSAGTCALAPQPRGTYQSTGGFVTWLDCGNDVMETWNAAWEGQRLAAQDVPGLNDFGVDLGLEFEDPDNASGSWIDRPTFGTEDESHTPVYVFDCDAAPIRSGDILNDTAAGPLVPNAGHNVQAYQVDVEPGNIGTPAPLGDGATLPALVNHTAEGAAGDCDTSNDAGHDFYGAKAGYLGEDDFNSVSGANKREADWNFGFTPRTRGQTGAVLVTPAGGSAGFILGPNYSDWRPGIITLTGPPTLRVDIAEGVVELPDASYLTFYAHVGQATIDRGFKTLGASGTYGQPQCGAQTSGIHNGWNCDATTWYRNPDGTPVPEPERAFARPGQVYELRDVDCYDGAVRALGVGVSTPYYGANPCAP